MFCIMKGNLGFDHRVKSRVTSGCELGAVDRRRRRVSESRAEAWSEQGQGHWRLKTFPYNTSCHLHKSPVGTVFNPILPRGNWAFQM